MTARTKTPPAAATDALQSWRDGPAKQAIVEFVDEVSGDGPGAVPVAERVAVFDNDGTLWCEKPMPIQLDFILRRLVEMAEADPGLREPPAVEGGLRARLRLARRRDGPALRRRRHQRADRWCGGILAAYDGISVEDFEARSDEFLRTAQHPTLGRGYLEMRLRADGRAARLSGGERVRELHRLGRRSRLHAADHAGGVRHPARARDRQRDDASPTPATSDGGTITHKAAADYLDDGPQKPIRIWSRTGRRPLLAAGNSNGDIAMLEFTQHEDKPSLRLLVLHDDAEREFDYTAGAEQALDRAAGGAAGRSSACKNDWATVF